MDVVIAGGHGQIARHLGRMLAGRGDRARGLIRGRDQRDDLQQDGIEPVILDLEDATIGRYADAIRGADAVVFAAGAGPGSGPVRKETVDYGAAAKLLAASQVAQIQRYVMISSMGAADPPTGDDVFEVYLRAKARADAELMASDRRWTIVRPGRLANEPGTGHVTLAPQVERGEIAREDVAAVLLAVLDDDRTVGHVCEVVGGATPIEDAIESLVT